MKENKQLCLECDCGAHYLTLTYFGPWQDEPPVAYLVLHTVRMPLWWRIKEAINLVLGRERLWDEFHFENFGNLAKLKKMVLELEKNFKQWEKLEKKRKREIQTKTDSSAETIMKSVDLKEK